MAQRLKGLVAELSVVVAHGRMKADQLDEAVLAFAAGRHDVLLTTAIIETGLDIPGADTIVIWRAERFGIAQLHQLRGRVGRGRQRAAAYLLHDPAEPLPPATEQRLRALETFEGLGAGFAISARDLDLRGAGDLLGDDQAGHLRLIGTELYQHLLKRALRAARGERVPEDWSPELNLDGVGYANPSDYVPEPELRLNLYARIARLTDLEGVDDLAEEIVDRFGPPPAPVTYLLQLARLRLRCRGIGVAKLTAGPKAVAATFRDATAAAELVRALAANEDGLRWSDPRLILEYPSASAGERLTAAAAMLDRIEKAAAGERGSR
jgi:transcription-repair coupling factor (superfamily II helicase)